MIQPAIAHRGPGSGSHRFFGAREPFPLGVVFEPVGVSHP